MKAFNRFIKISMFTLVFALIMCFAVSFPGTVALAANDDEAPVLINAFPVKDSYSVDENVEYILIFNEPGGININGTYGLVATFQMVDSPSPISTQLVLTVAYGTSTGAQVTDISAEYFQDHPDEYQQGYCAIKVSAPVVNPDQNNFMSGTYYLKNVLVTDMSGNLIDYGSETDSSSGGSDIPSSKGLNFTVDNPGADKISPVVQSIEFSSNPVSVGQTLTMTVKAYAPDGVDPDRFGYTLAVNDAKLIEGFYQYYPENMDVTVSEPDKDGIVTLTSAVTLPTTIPPGNYHIQQFSISDMSGNETHDSNVYPVCSDFTDIHVSIENPDYVYDTAPTITAFQMSASEAQPADTVDFTMDIDSHGGSIENNVLFYIMNSKGINIKTITLQSDDSDGRYHGSYTIPADVVPGDLGFQVGVHFKDGNFFTVYTLGDGEERLQKLHIGSVFTGLDDISLLVGCNPDELLNGVAASSGYDHNITGRIRIANPPDLTKTGVYLVRYEAPSTLPVVDPFTGKTSYANYIGYRWVGVTDTLPDNEDDPFVTTDSSLAIGGATDSDVSIRENLNGQGFSDVDFSDEYTHPGDYQVIKNDYVETQDSVHAKGLSGSVGSDTGSVLLCRIESSHSDTYRVFFNSNSGSYVPTIYDAQPGSTLTKPEDPTRIGWTFAGWYKDSAFKTAWNFSADTVTSDITLYAQWTINTYKVTFNPQNGAAVTKKAVNYNSTVSAPTPPTRSGYVFQGWYKEPSCIHAWNFATDKVTADITLYAKWVSTVPVPSAASASYTSVRIAWNTVPGAKGYEVSRATTRTGKYTPIATTTATSYVNTGLVTGRTYYYKVRSYTGSTKVYSGYSAIVAGRPVPAKVTPLRAARASSTSIKLTWGGVAGATRYEVWRSTSSGSGYALVTTTSSASYTNTRLATGRTYYYKVRAYHLESGVKVYGDWSAVASAKP